MDSFLSKYAASLEHFSSIGISPVIVITLSLLIPLCLLKTISDINLLHSLMLLFESLLPVPTIDLQLRLLESTDDAKGNLGNPMPKTSLRDPTKPNHIQCFDPSTMQYLGQVKAMTKDEVYNACLKAKNAQKKWSLTTFSQRRMVMRTIQKYIVNNVENICRVCARDSGKTKVDALLGEVMTTCEKIRCINSNGELWLRKSYRPTGPMMLHKTAYVEYVPFGVIGAIAPWNYPFHNMLNHIISSLYSGNAFVGKVSEHTSWSSDYFSRIVQAALVLNGHSPDLVQTITGFGEAGAAVVSCPSIDKIIFTGSPSVGKLVMAGASQYLKPVILELGGKDPMVFCDDVKLKEVLPWAMRGCFQNCGQNCCGVERIFAYEGIHDDFVAAITEKVLALRQGIPLKICGSTGEVDCGSMVMEGQMDIIQSLIDDAVSKGATLHCGGKRNPHLKGQFYEPTVISGITSEMRISQEEVFGPVMCIIKVPNNDDDECVRMINDCNFGLGSSVYSGNKKRAVAIGSRIKSGMFTANDFGVNYLIQSLPFGGVKESGFDRFAGPEGLRACCMERSIVVDRIPGVKTSIPPPIDYPVGKKGLPFGTSLVNLFYNQSVIGKAKAILGLIKNS